MKGGRSKRNIAKVTGIPFKAIDEVFKSDMITHKESEAGFQNSGQLRIYQMADFSDVIPLKCHHMPQIIYEII